ncbi:hypothetical protein [Sporomusa aerivorans]|uniref:hypothetical protein n=1 Tax=Sporomusa aerivorans TaxID=204936 RepID=UPI00352B84D4
MEYPSFTNSGFGNETIIISEDGYVLWDMVDKSRYLLGKTAEEAKVRLKQLNREHLAYQIP